MYACAHIFMHYMSLCTDAPPKRTSRGSLWVHGRCFQNVKGTGPACSSPRIAHPAACFVLRGVDGFTEFREDKGPLRVPFSFCSSCCLVLSALLALIPLRQPQTTQSPTYEKLEPRRAPRKRQSLHAPIYQYIPRKISMPILL